MRVITTNINLWDREPFLQQKLIEIIKRRCMAQPDHLNTMNVKTITENSGESTCKMKISWLTLIKLLINATKWTGKYSILRTFMRTLWYHKFLLNLTNSYTDFVNNSIKWSFWLKPKRDKLEFNNFKSKNVLKESSKISRSTKSLHVDPQMQRTRERST